MKAFEACKLWRSFCYIDYSKAMQNALVAENAGQRQLQRVTETGGKGERNAPASLTFVYFY